MGTAIGSGEWTVQVVGRGGSPLRHQVDFRDLDVQHVLNGSGRANVNLPISDPSWSACAEILRDSEPWRDEVLVWRDAYLDHAGPLVTVQVSGDGGSLFSPDLSHWLELRFLGDFHGDGDVAGVFAAIFADAMSGDTSPNIDISTRNTGIATVQDYEAVQFHRASDALRSLTEVGIDWTMVGRRMVAGGTELLADGPPLILHDDGVISAEMTKEGASLATDVAVFGSAPQTGGDPATGRATTGIETYGLIQRSFTELLLTDNGSCDSSAFAKLRAMQPAPRRLRVVLGPGCAFAYEDAIAGRRVDVRLSEVMGAGRINEEMRLQDKSVSVDAQGESVTLNLVPVGVGED